MKLAMPGYPGPGSWFCKHGIPIEENCFINWMTAIEKLKEGKAVAVDGKTLRLANYQLSVPE
jgi:hypothetical protein